MRKLLERIPGPLCIAICALLWSSGGLFIKLVDAPPVAIAGARSVIAALVLLLWIRKPKFTFSPAQIGAGIANALTMLLFVYANKTTTSANAILLQYASPVWTAILAMLFLKEKMRPVDVLALFGAAGGMVLFFIRSVGPGALLGDLAAVASGVTFAVFFILMRKQKDGSPFESFLISHIIVALAGIPFYGQLTFTAMNLAGIGLLGVVQIGLASIFFSVGIRKTTAVQSALVSLIEPVLNPVWVFLATGELPTVLAIIGGVVIVASVTAASAIKGRASSPSS